MAKTKYKILLFLFIVSLLSASVLAFFPLPAVCAPGKGCDVVYNSVYNFTFGIKNSLYGFFIFAFMSFMAFLQTKRLEPIRRNIINYGVIIGTLISGYFLYLQQFVLHAYCKYCLVVDFSMLIAFVVTLYFWKD